MSFILRLQVAPPVTFRFSSRTLLSPATSRTSFSANSCSVWPSTKTASLFMSNSLLVLVQEPACEEVEIVETCELELVKHFLVVLVVPNANPSSLALQDRPFFEGNLV